MPPAADFGDKIAKKQSVVCPDNCERQQSSYQLPFLSGPGEDPVRFRIPY
jgi:hypothetical protein